MSHNHHQKGTQVNHATPSAQAPSLRTGLFASLSGGGSGAPSLRLLALPATLLAVLAALLAFAAIPAPALAAPPTEFGTEGPGAGQINEPRGIAVDNKDSVYVADNNNRIDKFDSLALAS